MARNQTQFSIPSHHITISKTQTKPAIITSQTISRPPFIITQTHVATMPCSHQKQPITTKKTTTTFSPSLLHFCTKTVHLLSHTQSAPHHLNQQFQLTKSATTQTITIYQFKIQNKPAAPQLSPNPTAQPTKSKHHQICKKKEDRTEQQRRNKSKRCKQRVQAMKMQRRAARKETPPPTSMSPAQISSSGSSVRLTRSAAAVQYHLSAKPQARE
jgi:hypothetical protein